MDSLGIVCRVAASSNKVGSAGLIKIILKLQDKTLHILKNTPDYFNWLKKIKARIATSRIKAALSANHELIELYWFLGNQIVEKQKTANWGSGFINQFSRDLQDEFPEAAGFSPKNLRYCRAFFSFYSSHDIGQQVVAKFENDGQKVKWQQTVAKIKDASVEEVKGSSLLLTHVIIYIRGKSRLKINRMILIHLPR